MRLTNESRLGRLMRLPLRLVPRHAWVRILSGPARGYRWRVDSADHGCWIGWYESTVTRAIVPHLKGIAVAYDIGANAGYYTLMLARHAGHVYAVEPNADNVERHITANQLTERVTVLRSAVGESTGTVSFSNTGPLTTRRIDLAGGLTTPITALDDLNWPDPQFVKIDVEGHEAPVLRGMRRRLASRPTLLIAIHGEEPRRDVLAELARYPEYRLVWVEHDTLLVSTDQH